MKFIDEKGRLFGIINYIDLVIVLAVVLLVGGFVYLKAGKGDDTNYQPAVETDGEIVIDYFVKGVKNISVESVQNGDVFKSVATGNVIGEVIDKKVEPTTMTTTDEKGNVIESVIPDRYNMTIQIKSNGTVSAEEIKAYNEVIFIGKSELIQSKMSKFLSTIYGIDY